MVHLNGILIGQRPNGYSPFRVRLDTALPYGQTNRLRVDARLSRLAVVALRVEVEAAD